MVIKLKKARGSWLVSLKKAAAGNNNTLVVLVRMPSLSRARIQGDVLGGR
jgi:hypothetical protein